MAHWESADESMALHVEKMTLFVTRPVHSGTHETLSGYCGYHRLGMSSAVRRAQNLGGPSNSWNFGIYTHRDIQVAKQQTTNVCGVRIG